MKLSELNGKLVRRPGSNLSMKVSDDGSRLYRAAILVFKNWAEEWRDVSTKEIRLDEMMDNQWYEDKNPIHSMK